MTFAFLLGAALGGIVAAVSTNLLEGSQPHAVAQLNVEAARIAQLYADAVIADFETANRSQSRRAPSFARASLERAMDVRIYLDGPVNLFPGEKSGLRPLNLQTIDWTSGKSLTFEFVPPDLPPRQQRTYLAVAHPVVLHNRPIGAIVVARRP